MGDTEISQANDPCPLYGAGVPRFIGHATTNFGHVAVTLDDCSQGVVWETSDERKFR